MSVSYLEIICQGNDTFEYGYSACNPLPYFSQSKPKPSERSSGGSGGVKGAVVAAFYREPLRGAALESVPGLEPLDRGSDDVVLPVSRSPGQAGVLTGIEQSSR